MNRKLLSLVLLAVILLPLTACNNKEDPRVAELEAKLERIEEQERAKKEEANKAALEAEKEATEAEKARLEAELEAAKAEAEKAKQEANARPKFGPGNGNNLQGYNEGWLRIHTRSADGRLTLRLSPDQNAGAVTEIPNGTDEIYYFNRVKVGEYVWYQVEYFGLVGWLRGDYVHRY